MNDYKKYYPEFFDPANIEEPYLEPKKWSLWDEFINDEDSEINYEFAEFLWIKLQDASNDIDEIYEEIESGEVVKKPYDEVRKIFESNFEELKNLCGNEVYHNSPIVIDELVWNFGMTKRIAMLYCYGLYCIDRALRGYFEKHTEFSSQAFAYGVSAIDSATCMKLLSLEVQDNDVLRRNSSKAGRAKAARYQPLKDLARELVEKGNYKSRRSASAIE